MEDLSLGKPNFIIGTADLIVRAYHYHLHWTPVSAAAILCHVHRRPVSRFRLFDVFSFIEGRNYLQLFSEIAIVFPISEYLKARVINCLLLTRT